MPELPEVEHFRRLLLPLVVPSSRRDDAKSSGGLEVECPPPLPTRNFPDPKDLSRLKDYRVDDVKRKGKLIRMDLVRIEGKIDGGGKKEKKRTKKTPTSSAPTLLHLYLHMGMTGRISTPDTVVGLESLSGDDEYPPPHTHLVLRSNGHEAAFSDPRRFGVITLTDPFSSEEEGAAGDQFAELAPDAMDDLGGDKESLSSGGGVLAGLVGKRKGIKSLLLDQKAVVSGVGNWVADEVLYQSEIHPDQTALTEKEAEKLGEKLGYVLETAVGCMTDGREFPTEWLFHHRWGKGNKGTVKDSRGRRIKFLRSGGRTSAVVPSIQKIKSRRKRATPATKKAANKKKAAKKDEGEKMKTDSGEGAKGRKGKSTNRSSENAQKSGATPGGKRKRGVSKEPPKEGKSATRRRRSPRRS